MAEQKPKRYISDIPELMAEWNWEKNNELGLDPGKITYGSDKQVWWKCDKGHEWKVRVANRTHGNKCPYCSGRKVLVGFNDLATINSELAKEWHPTKNGDLKPTDVTQHSNKKVWWRCKHGHEWLSSIASRNSGYGCPYCAHNGTSKPELILLYYIRKFADCTVKHRYLIDKTEIDILLCRNNIKIGIEYDGYYHHKNKYEKDIEKNKRCQQLGIQLYRIREDPLISLNSTSIDILYNARNDCRNNYHRYSNIIQQLIFDLFGINVTVDIKKDKYDIDDFFKLIAIEESLATNYPELAKEWHPTKNGSLKPTEIMMGTRIKVWWLGKCGHEWQAFPRNRAISTTRNCGCPICAKKQILVGFNDLATTHPHLAKEWHPTKNGDLKPTEVTSGSHQKIWWLGECGHEWNTTISCRVHQTTGCPICAGKQVLVGFNDLATTHPHLAKEWHPTKNGDVKPTDVISGGKQHFWWLCECGHEWTAIISERKNGTGCPVCANLKRGRRPNNSIKKEGE